MPPLPSQGNKNYDVFPFILQDPAEKNEPAEKVNFDLAVALEKQGLFLTAAYFYGEYVKASAGKRREGIKEVSDR